MLRVAFYFYFAKCHYGECRYDECHYDECRYGECRYAHCRGASEGVLKKFFNILPVSQVLPRFDHFLVSLSIH